MYTKPVLGVVMWMWNGPFMETRAVLHNFKKVFSYEDK